MNIMKIAFIGQKGIPATNGGVERYVENLAIDLVLFNQEVLVYNRVDYLPTKLHEFKGIKIINKFYIKNKNLANITQTFLASLDVVRRQVDIVHFQGIGPSLLCWLPKLLKPRLKIIVTLHSFDYYNNKWSWFAKKMLQFGEFLMCRYADEIIVLTVSMQNYVKLKHHRETILIPNGAHLYTLADQDKLFSWGLIPGEYILSVSRLIKLKGLQYLIPAFKNLQTTKKLVIVGDGEYLSALEKLAAGDERIIFTGNQGGRVLDQLYANAYLFVQSSEMEGLSTSLLEAMAHRTACLTSDIIANRETLAGTGFTFVSKNITDLQTQLQKLISSPLDVESKAGLAYERIQREYTWSEIAKKILEVYKKLLVKAIVN